MNSDSLRSGEGVVCDLDGVLYRGKERVAGAAEAIDSLRQRGVRVIFATNNATATTAKRLAHMRAMGIEATPEALLTSAVVTAEHLKKTGWGGRSAFVIGKEGVREALGDAGVAMLPLGRAFEADLVVVSGDDGFTYDAMRAASMAVRRGAAFVATNDDATFPAADGLWPGAGAIVASIVTASGRKPLVMGKPHPPMMQAAACRLRGCERVTVVGDQPATDLQGAIAMGWQRVLVLSGVTDSEEARLVDPAPDAVLDSIADLEGWLFSSR